MMIKLIRLVFLKKKICKEHSDLSLITVFLLISVRRQISTLPPLLSTASQNAEFIQSLSII